jgi:hypothetical protein
LGEIRTSVYPAIGRVHIFEVSGPHHGHKAIPEWARPIPSDFDQDFLDVPIGLVVDAQNEGKSLSVRFDDQLG